MPSAATRATYMHWHEYIQINCSTGFNSDSFYVFFCVFILWHHVRGVFTPCDRRGVLYDFYLSFYTVLSMFSKVFK